MGHETGMLEVNERVNIPVREFRFSFARSSGPGGQNVNKLNTKATLRWSIWQSTSLPDDVRRRFVAKYGNRINSEGELLVVSQRYRDAGRNVADCIAKLGKMLEEVAVPPKTRKPTRPSRGSVRRRLNGKRRNAEKKQGRRPPRDE